MGHGMPILLILGIVLFIHLLLPFILTRVLHLGVHRRGRGGRHETQIAFTFDDGPDPQYTPALLDLLKQYDAKATFFVLGSKAEHYPQLIQRMHREGHQIGIHNYTHACNWLLPPLAVRHLHVEHTASVIEGLTGERPTCYRPPWGLLGMADWLSLRKSYPIVLWSVMGWDWKQQKQQKQAASLSRRLLGKIKPGAIILLHDSGDTLGADRDAPAQMLEALRSILPTLQYRGYTFVRTDELLMNKVTREYSSNPAVHPAGHLKSRVYE